MKKFLLVLSAILLLSSQVEARTLNNRHNGFSKPTQQVVINNHHNYNNFRPSRHSRPAQPIRHSYYKKDRTGEIAAITIGAVGVVALISALAY